MKVYKSSKRKNIMFFLCMMLGRMQVRGSNKTLSRPPLERPGTQWMEPMARTWRIALPNNKITLRLLQQSSLIKYKQAEKKVIRKSQT